MFNFEFWLIVIIVLLSGIVIADLICLGVRIFRKRRGKNEEKKDSKQTGKLRTFFGFVQKHALPISNILAVLFSGIILWQLFSPEPRVEYTYPSQDQLWEGYDHNVEIVFDRPVDTELLELNMSPETEGTWEFEYIWNLLPMTRRVKFYPSESFWPNEKIMIYVSNIANKMNRDKGNEYLLEFDSVALPEIVNASIEEEAVDVATNSMVEFELNQLDGLHNKWDIIITPEVEFEVEISDSELMKISFPNGLAQSTEYLIQVNQIPTRYDLETKEIIEEGESQLVKELKFTTVKAPLISSFSPGGRSVLPSSEIKIEFDLPMNTESVKENIAILPEVLGTNTWDEEGKILTITHDGLRVATDYTVTLKQGTESSAGGKFNEDVVYNFSTVGVVYVSGTSPASGATNVEINSNINVTFDQPVDHASAESLFSLSPNVPGTFSWSGNTMTYNPSADWGYSTTYTVTVQSGVKTVYGFDSKHSHSFSFTTKPQLVMIDIAWDGQDTPWTCNFAAAKMALSAKGVSVSENELINIATRQPAAVYSGYYIVGGGNPHKGFVDSFGTYWEPVSKAVSSYRQNMVKSEWTLAQACNEIAKGNPIVTWGQNGWSNDRAQSWTATDGETITGFSGMHSVVLRGCKGDLNNPTHVYIQDPWRKWGAELTAAEFLRRWGYFNYTGMVVY